LRLQYWVHVVVDTLTTIELDLSALILAKEHRHIDTSITNLRTSVSANLCCDPYRRSASVWCDSFIPRTTITLLLTFNFAKSFLKFDELRF
jgi:hypothetical protein